MQIPSHRYIAEKTTATLKRFPLTLISAALTAGLSIYLIDLEDIQATWLLNIVLVGLLGIPLFTAIQLIYEKRKWNLGFKTGGYFLGAVLLLIYYFLLPNDFDAAPYYHVYRYMLYFLGVHMLVAIGPYLNQSKMNAFWQYNKTLLLRFLTAVFYSAVLYIGLSIALLSIDVLLGIDFIEERYIQLFILIGGIFNTWFFLTGIPLQMDAFARQDNYPKGLKIFTQNILIPLVIIYLAILYLYTGKIIVQWSWPEGWVANLILSFSIVGILALLLLHPIRNNVENRWIKHFSDGYFWALIPLVLLLMLAIYRRIWEYGITIERYFVLVLGIWLTGMVLYFLISKAPNIKVIPASLCAAVFLISFGPWGAFSIAEQSQVNRLRHFFQQNDILINETIRKTSASVSYDDRWEISNILRYLDRNHGVDAIQPWFKQDLSQDTVYNSGQHNYYNRPAYIAELTGIDYVNYRRDELRTSDLEWFEIEHKNVVQIQNFNWLIYDLRWSPKDNLQKYKTGDGRTLIVQSNLEKPYLRIYFANDEADSLSVNLEQLIRQLTGKFPPHRHQIPAEAMTISSSSGNGTVNSKIYFEKIQWYKKDDSVQIETVLFDIAIK